MRRKESHPHLTPSTPLRAGGLSKCSPIKGEGLSSSQIELNWHSRSFSCGLWTDPPGQRWEDYVHEVDELLMVLEGELEVEIGGKVMRPKIGEEVFIPAHVKHSVRNVGGTASRWLYGYKREN